MHRPQAMFLNLHPPRSAPPTLPASRALCMSAITRMSCSVHVCSGFSSEVAGQPRAEPGARPGGSAGADGCAVIAVDRRGRMGRRRGPGSALSPTLPDSQVCGLISSRPDVSAGEIAPRRVPQADRHRCQSGGSLCFTWLPKGRSFCSFLLTCTCTHAPPHGADGPDAVYPQIHAPWLFHD